MESNGSSRSRRRLTESYVGNGSGSREHAYSDVFATGEAGNSFDDVVSTGDFENVRAHGGVDGFASDDDGRFGLVFGAGRTTSRSTNNFNGSSIATTSAAATAAATTKENRGSGGAAGIVGVGGLGFSRELEVMREWVVLVLVRVRVRVVEF